MKHALMVTAALLVSACGAYHEVKANPGAGLEELTDGTLSFETVKTTVLQPHCLNCHSQAGGNRGGINLETYAPVKTLAAQIRSAVESGFMPVRGKLPEREKQILFAWLDAGAPEFSDMPLPPEASVE